MVCLLSALLVQVGRKVDLYLHGEPLQGYRADLGRFRLLTETSMKYYEAYHRTVDSEVPPSQKRAWYDKGAKEGRLFPLSRLNVAPEPLDIDGLHRRPQNLPSERQLSAASLYSYHQRRMVEERYVDGKERVLAICDLGITPDEPPFRSVGGVASRVKRLMKNSVRRSVAAREVEGERTEEQNVKLASSESSTTSEDVDPRTSTCVMRASPWTVFPRQRYWMPKALSALYDVVAGPDSVSVSCAKRTVMGDFDNVTALGCSISARCTCPSALQPEVRDVYNVTFSFKVYHECYITGFVTTEFVYNNGEEDVVYTDKHHLPPFLLGVGTESEEFIGMKYCAQNAKYKWLDENLFF